MCQLQRGQLEQGRPRGERRMGVRDLPFLHDSCLPDGWQRGGGDLVNQKMERGKRDVVPVGGCCRAPAAGPSPPWCLLGFSASG